MSQRQTLSPSATPSPHPPPQPVRPHKAGLPQAGKPQAVGTYLGDLMAGKGGQLAQACSFGLDAAGEWGTDSSAAPASCECPGLRIQDTSRASQQDKGNKHWIKVTSF